MDDASDELAHQAYRVLRVLVCSALEPSLDGVLLLDLEPEVFTAVAASYEEVLAADGGPVRRVVLGAAAREDELWVRHRLEGTGQTRRGLKVTAVPGPLVDVPGEPRGLVLVPDLPRLSLAGMRAAVQLLGSDTARVDRHGFSYQWRPRSRWLAACRREEIGKLAPHLLDRFALRVDAAGLRRPEPEDVPPELDGVPPEPDHVPSADRGLAPLPEAWRAVLAAGAERQADLSGAGIDRVLDLVPAAAGHRRSLALAWLARALATLDGADTAGPGEVDAAARLIGLPTAPDIGTPTPPPDEDVPPIEDPAGPGGRGRSARDRGAGADEERRRAQRVLGPDAAEQLEAFVLGGPGAPRSPYPEDDSDTPREIAPLRIPHQRRVGPESARGSVIGVRRATHLRDMAFVPTAMEAAKYRWLPSRRAPGTGELPERLLVMPGDLRTYARTSEPEQTLVLLLDHTCRKGWDWQQGLAPYLRWAYAGRASVAVIDVGHGQARSDLRAEVFSARSVLDPRVAAALYRTPGRGSPLAHGLLLAQQFLRRAFQDESAGLREAWLVAVTDGRGNVPLDASLAGRVGGPVGRRGVDDALAVARQLGAVDRMRLHTVVVDPGARPYADLPFALADALGGVVVVGRELRVTGDVDR